ncbi:ABC transporter ATP-binding protein [Rhodococcus globerulus]|uniref:ABC transporter ATP-binding protein n=1 Tax=Rhodococcus globerulus TaxID=33008 RepID=A0ABU4C3C7_RHOGO|nr:ABC transporter ATP-binding protein [Rhodococcus globerulus]MDV6271003.1 ABC transporter ATP-binding protein [Rhodococcus globerulus]
MSQFGDAAPLLVLEELSVGYRLRDGRSRTVVNSVGLVVRPGEFVALVGESGSGKSTTAMAALGLLPANARVESGTVSLGGQDVTTIGDRGLAALRGPFVGYVPQDPGLSLNPVKRVGVQLVDAVRLHRRLPRSQARERALDKLELAGLSDVERIFDQYPHELSGGMRQRVLIAIALCNDPQLIIADEPTSALDVTVQKQILDHLGRLQTELGLGLLFVTHDLGVATERSDTIVVMNSGRIVEVGDPESLLLQPQSGYTKDLMDHAATLRPARLKPRVGAPMRLPQSAGLDDVIVEVSSVSKTYGDREVLNDVSLTLRRGTTHCIVGESGAGKSTLSRIVTALTHPDSGAVTFEGSRLHGRSRRTMKDVRRHLQFVYQDSSTALDPRFSVERVLGEPLRAFRIVRSGRELRERAVELLAEVGLSEEFLSRRPLELSGGQRQRVAIARALAARPSLVILDEPVSALDASVQFQILQLLTDLQAALGLTYMFVTHDLSVVRQIADDLTVMHHGQVVESGPASDILRAPDSPHTRSLIEAEPRPRILRSVVG